LSHNGKDYFFNAQDIKEGYYINKANAELMQYFKSKLNFTFPTPDNVKPPRDANGYGFKNFDLGEYDKFQATFTPQLCKATSKEICDATIDTKLVHTLVEMFGSNAKDIMFSCIRNDKNIGKALGAIDTLTLVRELKAI
jgi:hypothetical protein